MNFRIYKAEAPQGTAGLILWGYVIYIFLASALYSPRTLEELPFILTSVQAYRAEVSY